MADHDGRAPGVQEFLDQAQKTMPGFDDFARNFARADTAPAPPVAKYKFPWYGSAGGKQLAFRGWLVDATHDPAVADFLRENKIPFCLGNFLGNFIAEMSEGMGYDKFMGSIHVPVTARYGPEPKLAEHLLHIEFESTVKPKYQEPSEADPGCVPYDEDADWLPGTRYEDGEFRVTKLVGPLKFRSERWDGITMAIAPK